MSRRNVRSRRFASGLPFPSPILRYDPAAANVTKDGSDLVGTWNDLSANALHLTQGTGANKEKWISNGAPGGAYDVFEDDCAAATLKRTLKSSSVPTTLLSAAVGYTLFVVTKHVSAGSAAVNHSVFSYASNVGRGGWLLAHRGVAGAAVRRFECRKISDGSIMSVDAGTPAADTWEIWAVSVVSSTLTDDTTATITWEVNGAAVATSGSPWFGIPSPTPSIIAGVGTATGSPVLRHGHLECYPLLNANQRATRARQLGALYGITVA